MRRRGSGAQEGAPKPRAKQPAAIDTVLVLDCTSRGDDKKDVKKKDAAHRKFPTAAAAGDGTDGSGADPNSDADGSYEPTGSSPSHGSRSSESEDGEDEGSGSDSSSISTTTTSISKRDGSSDLDSDSVAAVKARGSSRRSGRKRSREQVNYNLNAGDEKFEERLQAYQKQMPTRKKRAAATKKIEDIAATSTNIADVDRRQTGNEQRLPFPCTFQSPITAASTPDLSLLPSLGRLPENQSAMYLLQKVSPPIISGTKAATTKGPADPPIADGGNREDDFGAALQAAILLSPELFP